MWKNYFELLLNGEDTQVGESLEYSSVPVSCQVSNLDFSEQLNGVIAPEEVEYALHQVNSEATPGADGISVRMMSLMS